MWYAARIMAKRYTREPLVRRRALGPSLRPVIAAMSDERSRAPSVTSTHVVWHATTASASTTSTPPTVPVRWNANGSVSTEPWAFWDVLPTLAELAGVDVLPADDLDGASIAPLLRGERGDDEPPRYLYFTWTGAGAAAYRQRGPPYRSVRDSMACDPRLSAPTARASEHQKYTKRR